MQEKRSEAGFKPKNLWLTAVFFKYTTLILVVV